MEDPTGRGAARVPWRLARHRPRVHPRDGEGHRPKRLSSTFSETTDRLGLERIGVHGLRHSYATAALRAGVSPEVLAKRLGHADPSITLSIYAHVFEQDDQAAAERVADAIFGA